MDLLELVAWMSVAALALNQLTGMNLLQNPNQLRLDIIESLQSYEPEQRSAPTGDSEGATQTE